jgi:pimeloyl-ACP methyl ester carboxylesterase/DNA-binding CsgD family transcriptional regulator
MLPRAAGVSNLALAIIEPAMDAPPVQYVKTSDGYDIAYGVCGRGLPLLALTSTFEHVQLAWQYPGLDTWLEGFSERFRLIQLDPRGTGLSTRGLPSDYSLDLHILDIEAVVDTLGLDRFLIYAVGNGSELALRYAARHPERVQAYILASAALKQTAFAAASVFFTALPEHDWDLFLYSLAPRGQAPEESRRRVELLKQAYTQQDFLTRIRAVAGSPGVEEIVKHLKGDFLILHARDYALLDVTEAMNFSKVANGKLVVLDGANSYGDAGQGLRAVDRFIGELQIPTAEAVVSHPANLGNLSAREGEVLRLLAAGRSNQQIADELVISINTVIRHVAKIFDKTGAANRAQATAYAKDHGIA